MFYQFHLFVLNKYKLMNGYYLYDDEGVKARRVDNVVDGVLKEFLMMKIDILTLFPEMFEPLKQSILKNGSFETPTLPVVLKIHKKTFLLQ